LIVYDLNRLFEHPMKFRPFLPSAIAAFGGQLAGQFALQVRWRRSAKEKEQQAEVVLQWDVATLKHNFAEIEEEILIARYRNENVAVWTEHAAVIVAVAVMAMVEPEARFTQMARIGTANDFYLNNSKQEMIEIAGRWEGGLPSLFEEKQRQSEQNQNLRKRWISVTVFTVHPRNRTEGLHP
jgi:hypothetical protein